MGSTSGEETPLEMGKALKKRKQVLDLERGSRIMQISPPEGSAEVIRSRVELFVVFVVGFRNALRAAPVGTALNAFVQGT
jgi:hypothetical protein